MGITLQRGCLQGCVGSDVIYAERRGQSQKPEEIYQLIEELVPGGDAFLLACLITKEEKCYARGPCLLTEAFKGRTKF